MPTFGEMLAAQLKGETEFTKEEFEAQARKQMPSMTHFSMTVPTLKYLLECQECPSLYREMNKLGWALIPSQHAETVKGLCPGCFADGSEMKKPTNEELAIARNLYALGSDAIRKASRKAKYPPSPIAFEKLEPQSIAGWIAIVRYIQKHGLRPATEG